MRSTECRSSSLLCPADCLWGSGVGCLCNFVCIPVCYQHYKKMDGQNNVGISASFTWTPGSEYADLHILKLIKQYNLILIEGQWCSGAGYCNQVERRQFNDLSHLQPLRVGQTEYGTAEIWSRTFDTQQTHWNLTVSNQQACSLLKNINLSRLQV